MYAFDVTEFEASVRVRRGSSAVVKFTCKRNELPRDHEKPTKSVTVEIDDVTHLVSARDYVYAMQLASIAIFEKRKEARLTEQSVERSTSSKKKHRPSPEEFQQYWAERIGEKD